MEASRLVGLSIVKAMGRGFVKHVRTGSYPQTEEISRWWALDNVFNMLLRNPFGLAGGPNPARSAHSALGRRCAVLRGA